MTTNLRGSPRTFAQKFPVNKFLAIIPVSGITGTPSFCLSIMAKNTLFSTEQHMPRKPSVFLPSALLPDLKSILSFS